MFISLLLISFALTIPMVGYIVSLTAHKYVHVRRITNQPRHSTRLSPTRASAIAQWPPINCSWTALDDDQLIQLLTESAS